MKKTTALILAGMALLWFINHQLEYNYVLHTVGGVTALAALVLGAKLFVQKEFKKSVAKGRLLSTKLKHLDKPLPQSLLILLADDYNAATLADLKETLLREFTIFSDKDFPEESITTYGDFDLLIQLWEKLFGKFKKEKDRQKMNASLQAIARPLKLLSNNFYFLLFKMDKRNENLDIDRFILRYKEFQRHVVMKELLTTISHSEK